MRLTLFLKLMRVPQWYKNLVIFLAIFFSVNLLNPPLLIKTIIGFFSLCFISSAYYILNDLKDAEKDRLHPEKRLRPLASGRISKKAAIVISGLCVIASLALGLLVSLNFLLFPAGLFFLTVLYTLSLKEIPIVDIHLIAVNYIIRALAGVYIAATSVSPWLILFVFILALFLAVTKRKSDIIVANKSLNKPKIYNLRFLEWMSIILLGAMLFTYILYTFLAFDNFKMMLTIPLASYMIFKYLYYVSINHKISRRAELFFMDKSLLTAFIVWVLLCFVALYI